MSRALVVAAALVAAIAACSNDDHAAVPGTGGAGGTGGVGGTAIDFSIPGLGAPAEVSFDEQGVLHAACQTDEDCATVLGFFHAQNRFYQMDLYRRVARGRGATLIALYDIEDDVYMRRFMSLRDGTPIEEAIWAMTDEATKSIVEAYARGVNAWLADMRAGRNGATLTAEYSLPVVAGDPAGIPDWEPLDTIAFARLMTWQLSESSAVEGRYGPAFPRLPAHKAVALFTLAPASRTYTLNASGESYTAQAAALRSAPGGVDLEAIHKVQVRLDKARYALELAADAGEAMRFGRFAPAGDSAGSNNWVVAPGRTAAGKALLANDPHLGLSNPPVWYFAELDAKTHGEGTMHVAGGTFPGIPGVPIGRNENVAWGATVAYYDVTDVYVETLSDDGSAVLFDADGDGTPEEVKIVTREHTFGRIGQAPVTRTLKWVPHHGPVVSEDPGNGVAVTVRWTGHEATDELTAFLGLARAANIGEAREALRSFKVGAQNFVLADTNGKIGWWPHANVPKRPWASFNQAAPTPIGDEHGSLPPWLPLPGDGSAEWDGYLSDEELPQLWDPASGFVATANQPMTEALEDGDPTNDPGIPVLQTGAAVGFRQTRIVDRLQSAENEHTPETMHALQADTHSLPGEAIVPALLAAADASNDLAAPTVELVEALRAWRFTCPTGLTGNTPESDFDPDEEAARESAGCTAFHYTLPKIYAKAFGDELRQAGVPISHELIRPLTLALNADTMPVPFDPNVLWDDMETADRIETRDEILLAALAQAGSELVTHLGADSNRWRWGRIHTVTLAHDLAQLNPKMAHGPFANDGGLFTVDVANPSATATAKRFSHGSGASLRMVNEAGADGMTTWLQLPGGQDLHRAGAHYNDLLDAWLENEPFVLPFTREEADAAATSRLVVGP